jgi:DNA polymerase
VARGVREELAGIAAEARVLLERERAKGRKRIVLAGVEGESALGAGGDVPSGAQTVGPASPGHNSPGGNIPPRAPRAVAASAARTVDAAPGSVADSVPGGQAALPGFESLAPPPIVPASRAVPGLPATQPLVLRDDLPRDLDGLSARVAECRLCPLCETRNRTVFSDGDPKARLLFVGEAPGADEDAQGVPFVGRAGQLLNKMIAAIDIRREEVYICNVLKCRPPGNRTPQPDEVARCLPYLEQQIALVRPALICAMGLPAVAALLRLKGPMAAIHGKMFEYRGIPVIPTYHPAALLRTPSFKRQAWEDLQVVRDTLKRLTA